MREINDKLELVYKICNNLWSRKADGQIIPNEVFDSIRNEVESYMQELHAKQYIGLDDDMPDDFETWLSMQIEENDLLATVLN